MSAESQPPELPKGGSHDRQATEAAISDPPDREELPLSLLAAIEAQLSATATPAEAARWAQVRGEILRQNADADWAQLQRFLDRFQFFVTFGLSVGAFAAAIALLIARRQDSATLLLLGAASYPLGARATSAVGRIPSEAPSSTERAPASRGGVATSALLFLAAASLLAARDILGLGTPSLAPIAAFACGLFAIATVGQLQARSQLDR